MKPYFTFGRPFVKLVYRPTPAVARVCLRPRRIRQSRPVGPAPGGWSARSADAGRGGRPRAGVLARWRLARIPVGARRRRDLRDLLPGWPSAARGETGTAPRFLARWSVDRLLGRSVCLPCQCVCRGDDGRLTTAGAAWILRRQLPDLDPGRTPSAFPGGRRQPGADRDSCGSRRGRVELPRGPTHSASCAAGGLPVPPRSGSVPAACQCPPSGGRAQTPSCFRRRPEAAPTCGRLRSPPGVGRSPISSN